METDRDLTRWQQHRRPRLRLPHHPRQQDRPKELVPKDASLESWVEMPALRNGMAIGRWSHGVESDASAGASDGKGVSTVRGDGSRGITAPSTRNMVSVAPARPTKSGGTAELMYTFVPARRRWRTCSFSHEAAHATARNVCHLPRVNQTPHGFRPLGHDADGV